MPDISRRLLLVGGASTAVQWPLLAEGISTPDLRLLALHTRFRLLAAKIDRSIEGGGEVTWDDLEAFERAVAAIETRQASSVAGLRLKAEVASWALMGRPTLLSQASLDARMGRSIIRDLLLASRPKEPLA